MADPRRSRGHGSLGKSARCRKACSQRSRPTPKGFLFASLVGHDACTHIHTHTHSKLYTANYYYIHTHKVIENKIMENLRERNSRKSKSRGRKNYGQGSTQHFLHHSTTWHSSMTPEDLPTARPVLPLEKHTGCPSSRCSRGEHLRDIWPDMLGHTFNPRTGRGRRISGSRPTLSSSKPRVTKLGRDCREETKQTSKHTYLLRVFQAHCYKGKGDV